MSAEGYECSRIKCRDREIVIDGQNDEWQDVKNGRLNKYFKGEKPMLKK